MNEGNMKYTFCESLRKNQCVDKNGNSEIADSVNSNLYGNPTRGLMASKGNDDDEPTKQIDQKSINRLQAMAISDDDDDYGEH